MGTLWGLGNPRTPNQGSGPRRPLTTDIHCTWRSAEGALSAAKGDAAHVEAFPAADPPRYPSSSTWSACSEAPVLSCREASKLRESEHGVRGRLGAGSRVESFLTTSGELQEDRSIPRSAFFKGPGLSGWARSREPPWKPACKQGDPSCKSTWSCSGTSDISFFISGS